ncbi:proton pump-interactor 4-like [Mangifera indica]|uniref:proton pump-interactor 4-like n=1 Tax=Mangifera indica TaxID=29780 RepID=UPI001CF9B152|nr:proton pump-interactor 4-like [Mangifera indica]
MKKCDEIGRRKDEVNQHILNLKRQQAETRSRYQRYVSVMNNARKLSQKKDVKALEELSLRQVGIFMSKWNKSEVFRCNYEKSMVQSLQIRQLYWDGRIRNLDKEEEQQLLLNC